MLAATRGGRVQAARRQRFLLMLGDADRALRALVALRDLLAGLRPEHVPRALLTTAAARLDEIATALQGKRQESAAALRPLDVPAVDREASLALG